MSSHLDFLPLINQAKALAVKQDITPDVMVGKVGCVVISESGKTYTGLSIKASGDLGFCAEMVALSQMLQAGETSVDFLVAVNTYGEVIPPCGRCREFLYQINRDNLNTQIIMNPEKTVVLEKLLPHRWQEYWSNRA